MIKKVLSDSFKVLTGVGLFATLHSYNLTLEAVKDAKNYKNNYVEMANMQKKIENFEETSEITNLKSQSIVFKIKDCQNVIGQEKEILQNIDPEKFCAISDTAYHSQILTKKTAELQNLAEELASLSKSNKVWNGQSWLDLIQNVYTKWTEIHSNLNVIELGALFHLLAAIFIFICLFTIIGIIYSDFLLAYFKLEQKYPKLGHFLRIRKAFQHYYLLLNFSLIVITLFAIIYINIYVFI